MKDELDILREVGSIASAHAGSALSEILGRRINLLIPSLDFVSSAAAPKKINIDQMGIAVIARLTTGIKGQAVFMLEEKNAFKLIDLSYKVSEQDKKSDLLTELGVSTIKEIGNIVMSAYLNAIGLMLKRIVLFLPPAFISGTFDEILHMVLSSSKSEDYMLLIEAVFEEPNDKIKGAFYLVLEAQAASDIRNACQQALKEL
ncbi:hypothetical protein EPN16_00755 [bacterium]|nr:MAG: hypothetical protein EPN16_00755 [bacterium]